MTALALAVLLATPMPRIECPACPGDPPWRWMTCFMLTHMAEPWDRVECPDGTPLWLEQRGLPVLDAIG